MGMYELMEGKEVNGRGVWQMAGGGWSRRWRAAAERLEQERQHAMAAARQVRDIH
jgi:hypothetical protein